MGQKYKALRFIAMAMKALGFIVAVLTVLSALGICGTGVLGGATLDRFGRDFGQNTSGLGIITGLVGGLIAMVLPIILGGSLAMFLFSGGEAINLQIDIEENTRTMAWFLQRQPWAFAHTPADLSLQQANTTAPSSASLPVKEERLPEHNPPRFFMEIPTSFSYCPQCGTKVTASDSSCPNCNYEFIRSE